MIPLVDLKRLSPEVKRSIGSRINKVIGDSDFILGKEVVLFEKEFANYVGTKYCIGVNSGTDAIKLGLKALGISNGDEVIVPATTFFASASPVIMVGANPVFVDIDPDTALINPNKIEQAITKKTKAIMIVHLYGNSNNLEDIIKIAKKHKLYIVEDACQAHGSKYRNKTLGSFGDFAAFSFYPGKNLGAYGDAGAITTSNANLAEILFLLRNHGAVAGEKYIHKIFGFNSRMDSIQAAVLRIKLNRLNRDNKIRSSKATLYKKLLSDLNIKIILPAPSITPNYHLFVIKTSYRNELLAYLRTKKIFCGIHYPTPLHLEKALNKFDYKEGDFPYAEKHARECLSLPIFPEITNSEIKFICSQIKNFFKEMED